MLKAGPLRALGWGDGDALVGVGGPLSACMGRLGLQASFGGEMGLAPAVLEMGAVSFRPERKA